MFTIGQTTRTYTKALLCIMVLVSTSACDRDAHTKNGSDFNVEVDTVNQWIKKGRNKDLSNVDRDSLLAKAYEATSVVANDSLRTKLLSRLSLAYLALDDSLQFRETNKATLQLAKLTQDSVSQAEAHWDLAEFFRKNGISDSAYFHFAEAQKIYDELNNTYYSGRMLYNMAIVQGDVKDYTGSEITTIKAIELLKPLNKYKELYRCYNNLGVVATNLGEYDNAIAYNQQALEYLLKTNKNSSLQYHTQNNIGFVYQEQNKHKEAIPHFKKVVDTDSLFHKDTWLYATALDNLAYSQFKSGDTNNVIEQLVRALEIRDSIGDFTGLSRSYYNLAEYNLNQKDTLKAFAQGHKAREFAEESSNNLRLLETLQLLGRIDPDNSLAYTQRYITLSDSLQQEERQARDKFARIRFETNEFIAENEVLTKEKKLWAGIALSLLLMTILGYVVIDQRIKNQKLRFQKRQQAANEEIFHLMLAQSQKVEEGKKMEQKRISEELHDGVIGKLMGARMLLTGLNKRSDEASIAERSMAIGALQELEGEVREISHDLSNTAYQKIHNFVLSIKQLVGNVGKTTGLKTDFQYHDPFDWDGLNGKIKINLYRMVQEVLQNSVKHAQCKQISVDFLVKDDRLLISISDDGNGFDTKKGRKGIGMRNIVSRVKKLNGTWHIESAPGEGTKVTFDIPTESHDHNGTKNSEVKKLQEV